MHLTQLRKAKLVGHNTTDDSDRRFYPIKDPLLSDIKHQLSQAEHFHFTAIPEDSGDIQASVAAMKEAGVWHLPYPVTTFEFIAMVTVLGEEKGLERFILLTTETPNGPTIGSVFVKLDKHKWMRIPESDELEYDTPTLLKMFDAMMVLLVTKGIRRERYIGDHPVLKHRPMPANSYTRVMIAETIATGQGSPVAERNRVRLHLRRGHVRHQPFGAGRSNTKLIWIEPMLVGYSEEGTIEHTSHEIKNAPTRHQPK